MPMSTRIDPLLNELCQGSQQAESHAIRASLLQAIGSVLDAGHIILLSSPLTMCPSRRRKSERICNRPHFSSDLELSDSR
jgi:hypothetical protein